MKSVIIIPIFFLLMLVALIIYDSIGAVRIKKDLLLKEDRIHFHDIVVKAGHTNYSLNIDSFHYMVFIQPNDHESRAKMLEQMDSLISVFADRLQILP
ncbi:hypothetical protein BH10BAC2_BH10BAC2_07630 [soil metagenome]